MDHTRGHWRRCSTCKDPIPYRALYWVCSVSTCNRKRTGLVFCSVPCWDAHVPMMRHREAWAEERTAPSREQWVREQDAASASETRRTETFRSATSASSKGIAVRRRPAELPGEASRKTPSRAILRPGPTRQTTAAPAMTWAPESRHHAAADSSAPHLGDNHVKGDAASQDVLVVASRLKAYVRARSGMNTSSSVLDVLSDRIRQLCDRAIEVAARDGRKTLMDRDFE